MLSLSLSLSENKRAQRERESLVGEKAAFRDAQRFADDVSKSSASLSLSLVLCLYKFEEETAPLFWGKVFRYLSLCVFK